MPPAASQRVPSSANSRRIHAPWHEADAGAPGRLTGSTTGVEGAAVVQSGCPRQSSSNVCCLKGWNGAPDPKRTSAVLSRQR
jgi:hypothetical protein